MNRYKKEVIIIAGANGSGKTTFAKELLKSINYEFLNADEMAKELNPENLYAIRITAGKQFILKIHKTIESAKNFIIETTLSGDYIEKIINLLKEKDYSVIIIFLFLESKEACINRIKQRILKGEHHVPDKDVIRRYYRGKNKFWNKYRHLVDLWVLVENITLDFQEVAYGAKKDNIITNENLFKIFQQDIDKANHG